MSVPILSRGRFGESCCCVDGMAQHNNSHVVSCDNGLPGCVWIDIASRINLSAYSLRHITIRSSSVRLRTARFSLKSPPFDTAAYRLSRTNALRTDRRRRADAIRYSGVGRLLLGCSSSSLQHRRPTGDCCSSSNCQRKYCFPARLNTAPD